VITTNGGNTAFLEGHDVRIEDSSGTVIASRYNARRFFPYGRRALWWDRLDQAYFASYALWNYLTFPALLLWEDIVWTEIADGKLQAWFPSQLPTHCDEQHFHFDERTGLLQQHHYTAEVIGEWARACNVVLEHGDVDGIPYASHRRITPRKPNGEPRSGPLLVGAAQRAAARGDRDSRLAAYRRQGSSAGRCSGADGARGAGNSPQGSSSSGSQARTDGAAPSRPRRGYMIELNLTDKVHNSVIIKVLDTLQRTRPANQT
jgi:hypothetical protein